MGWCLLRGQPRDSTRRVLDFLTKAIRARKVPYTIFDALQFRSFRIVFSCGPQLTTQPSMSRQLTGPTDTQSPTRHGEGSSTDPPLHTYGSHTSLPSIRQLHPYLPLSSLSQHLPTSSGESSGYNYPHFVQQLAQPIEPQTLGARRSSEAFGSPDSDGDEVEQRHGPPKKKRRRQPLSCTGQSGYYRIVLILTHTVSYLCDVFRDYSVVFTDLIITVSGI